MDFHEMPTREEVIIGVHTALNKIYNQEQNLKSTYLLDITDQIIEEAIEGIELELAGLKRPFFTKNFNSAVRTMFWLRRHTAVRNGFTLRIIGFTDYQLRYRRYTPKPNQQNQPGYHSAALEESPVESLEACINGYGRDPLHGLIAKKLKDKVQKVILEAEEAAKELVSKDVYGLVYYRIAKFMLYDCPAVIVGHEVNTLLCLHLGLDPSNEEHRNWVKARKSRAKIYWLKELDNPLAQKYVHDLFERSPAKSESSESPKEQAYDYLRKVWRFGEPKKNPVTIREGKDLFSEDELDDIARNDSTYQNERKKAGNKGCNNLPYCLWEWGCPCKPYLKRYPPKGPSQRVKSARNNRPKKRTV